MASFRHLQINIYTGGFDSLSPVAQLCVKLWYGSHGKARYLEFSCGNAWPGSLWYGSLGLVVMVEFVAVGKAVYGLAVMVLLGTVWIG